jgi:hypothetical protein
LQQKASVFGGRRKPTDSNTIIYAFAISHEHKKTIPKGENGSKTAKKLNILLKARETCCWAVFRVMGIIKSAVFPLNCQLISFNYRERGGERKRENSQKTPTGNQIAMNYFRQPNELSPPHQSQIFIGIKTRISIVGL